jgi:hypothetical protein
MAEKLPGTAIVANTITTTQLQTTVVTQIQAGGGPKVTTITYPNSATAAVNTGNQSIVLTGTGFESGVQVYVNGSAVPSVSRTNSTSLSFTTPALTTGTTYPLYVVNPDGGTAVVVPGMVVSAGPVWVTASPLPSWGVSSALSRTLTATSDSTISYALDVGSSLPSGLSLAANGLLSGTLTSPPVAETTYNFTVVATDLELQKSSKAFSVNATIGIQATGGTVSNISGYRVHTFTSSGSFQVTSGSGDIEYLVVAGGGGGGSLRGGGGGAGGFRTGTGFAVTAGNTYTITVGAGGAGAVQGTRGRGSSGSSSIFDTITSAGGGGGGGDSVNDGANGGSGGGASRTGSAGVGNTPSTSPSQGNNGGTSTSSSPSYGAGGGGGAGAAGAQGSGSIAGNGGNGTASSITGTSVTYAGGGGGAADAPGTAGTGGSGGGGAGLSNGNGTAGTTNLGGGGGGGGYTGAEFAGGAGGSGVVIIRYAA